jgi:hypothetical protein
MPPRVISDGIYDEAWDGIQRDLFVYLVLKAANPWGLFVQQPKVWAAALRHQVPTIVKRLDALISQEVLLRYHVDGGTYLAFRKWQDHQGIRHFPRKGSNVPCPSADVFQLLSEKTQQNFRIIADSLPAPVAVAVAVGSDTNVSVDVRAAQDYFFGRLQTHTGLEKPVFSWGQSGRFFKGRMQEADDTLQDFKDTIDEFFDRYIRGDKSAGNFGHYQRVYNALCIAVQKRRRQCAHS